MATNCWMISYLGLKVCARCKVPFSGRDETFSDYGFFVPTNPRYDCTFWLMVSYAHQSCIDRLQQMSIYTKGFSEDSEGFMTALEALINENNRRFVAFLKETYNEQLLDDLVSGT